MKKKEDDENKKYIKETLAKSKTITKSVNIFMAHNKLGQNQIPQDSTDENRPKNIFTRKKNNKNIKNDDNSDDEIEEETNIDEDDEGIFTLEYVTSNIERYQKKVTKFDEMVKKYLLLSKKYPNKKDEYKDEAVRALKKKKFYGKALERYENRKLKLELKSLDKEYKLQKKELKKLTRDLKKKVKLVTMGQDYDENIEGDDSGSSDEDNIAIFAQIDLDEKSLNEQYEQIINMPEVKKASENLNLFKFIFQEE